VALAGGIFFSISGCTCEGMDDEASSYWSRQLVDMLASWRGDVALPKSKFHRAAVLRGLGPYRSWRPP